MLVLDALDGVTEQDQKLMGRIVEEGRACVLVINKWDAIDKDSHTIYDYDQHIDSRFYYVSWAQRVYVSAHTGQRLQNILDLANIANAEHKRRVSTSVINEVLEDAISWKSPPTNRQGRQGKIYYGTQVRSQPPTITLFVNDPKRFNDNYRRYIERQLREQLGFTGTPMRLIWRGKKPRDVETRGTSNRAIRV